MTIRHLLPNGPIDSDPDQRAEVMELFEQLSKPHQDSDYPNVKLLPFWHGTDPARLDRILRMGYATMSPVSRFGRGFYSSYEAEHALKGISNGVLILNWVATYSPYPVIESDQKELEGKAVYKNYDAHFVWGQHAEVIVFESAACLPQVSGQTAAYNDEAAGIQSP